MEERPQKTLRIASFAVHAARGLIRNSTTRRMAMVVLLACAVIMSIAGSTFLRGMLDPKEHTGSFIIFWLACAWLTLTAVLLAFLDLLLVRVQARAARRALAKRLASEGG